MQSFRHSFTAALIACSFAMVAARPARGALYRYDPARSSLGIAIGNLPALTIPAADNPSAASLSFGVSKNRLSVQAGQFVTAGASLRAFAGQTALLTGVPLLTRLSGTVSNGSGAFTLSFGNPTTSSWQGAMGIGGGLVMRVAGATGSIPVSLLSLSGFSPASTIVLTGITTPLVSTTVGHRTGALITLQPSSMQNVVPVTGYTSVLHTVTFSGSTDVVTTSGGGMLAQFTMVKPIRVTIGQTALPGVVRARFTFVPEPGSLALGLTSVSTLLWLGWRRARSRS